MNFSKIFFLSGAVFIFGLFFSACSAQNDELLVGTWHRAEEGAITYTFYADGTGERGFPEDRQYFTWGTTASGRLNIDRVGVAQGDGGIREERWNYSIANGVLSLESRQVSGAEFVYVSAGAGGLAEELFGVWHWDERTEFAYLFAEDGTGVRGIFRDETAEEISWFTNHTRLHIYSPNATFGVRGEMWTFSVDGDVLTLQSDQWPDVYFIYHASRIVLPYEEQ